MVKLHLVGFSSDLKSLVFSTRRGAKSGTYTVDVNPRLKRTLEEIERRQARSEEEPAVEEPAPAPAQRSATPRPQRTAVPPSKISPKEIQALLREGKTPAEVATIAEAEVSWIERFTSPIMAERAVVIDIVRAARISRPRRGLSSLPVGEAVVENLADKNVQLSPEELEEGWNAVRREGQWEVSFSYRSRGRGMDAAFSVDHDRNVRAANPQALALGWRPVPGEEDDDEVAASAPEKPPPPVPMPERAGDPGAVSAAALPSDEAPARPEPARRPAPPPGGPGPATGPAQPAGRAAAAAQPRPSAKAATARPKSGLPASRAGAPASKSPASKEPAPKDRASKTSAAKGAAGSKPRPAPAAGGTAAPGPARTGAGGGAKPASPAKPAPVAPQTTSARRRQSPPTPPLRPGQAVSLADVGWSLPADRNRPRRPVSGPGQGPGPGRST